MVVHESMSPDTQEAILAALAAAPLATLIDRGREVEAAPWRVLQDLREWMSLEWRRDGYLISTDLALFDREVIWRFLRTTYELPGTERAAGCGRATA
jgi:hypothetical protein